MHNEMIKFKDILQESILTPRRSKEDREKNHKIAILKQVQNSMNNVGQGDLDLSNVKFDITFPDNITVIDGSLNLRNSKVSKLPKNLKYVLGDLNLRGSNVSEIPDSLLGIHGSLHLEDLPILSLKNIRKAGEIYLDGNTTLSKLPDNLNVRVLSLSDSDIKKLPSGLNVRDLNIENTHIAQLPNDLIIRGSVYASGSQLSHIDRNISCYNLEIHNTPFLYDHFFNPERGIENIRKKLKEYFPNVRYVRGFMRDT